MAGLLLIALGVGLGNFAVSIAIGLGGVDRRTRLRVGLVFACFEGGMPVLGALVGSGFARHLGGAAHVAGGALLVVIGAYQVVSALRSSGGDTNPAAGTFRLLVTAFALSIDNFVAGLALASLPVSLPVVAGVIAVVSGTLSLLGLEIANRLGALVERRASLFGGVALGGVGVALMTGVLS